MPCFDRERTQHGELSHCGRDIIRYSETPAVQSDQFRDPNGFLIPSVGTPDLTPNKTALQRSLIFTKPGIYRRQFTRTGIANFRVRRTRFRRGFSFPTPIILPSGGRIASFPRGTLASSISATD